MRREKRSARVVAYIHPSKAEALQDLAYRSNVTSISDYLFELIEEHIEVETMRISKQTIVARGGRN